MEDRRTASALLCLGLTMLTAALLVACSGSPGDAASKPTATATATAGGPPTTVPTVTPTQASGGSSTPTSTPRPPVDQPFGVAFDLAVGEDARVEATGWSISFDSITADSRCPVDVTCVWAGEVTAAFLVSNGNADQDRLEVTLDPNTDASVGFGSFVLTLLEVAPSPRSSVPIAPGDYTVTIRVEPQNAAAPSGIQGLITLGPQCPVVRQDQPCPDKPYAALILVTDATGKEVARAMSNADGLYSLALPPGNYTVAPQRPSNNILPFAAEFSIAISQGQWLTMDISYDTGIR